VTTDAREFPKEARAALHDERLQGALTHLKEGFQVKRASAFAAFPVAFEELREQGRAIRASALSRLGELLVQFEAQVQAHGGQVHWARDAAEARDIVTRILKERGHLNLLKGLVTLEGSCSLPNSGLTAADFDNVAYMALKGDYTATSAICQETVDAINARRASKQGTAKADYLKLDEMGILGVTHMMMLDKKNLEIADVIYNWIGKNVPTSRNRRSTSTR